MLNSRQTILLRLLEQGHPCSAATCRNAVEKRIGKTISRITLHRDLKGLTDLKYAVLEGRGRGANYKLSPQYRLLFPIDSVDYFSKETDERRCLERFNFDIFSSLSAPLLTDEEDQLLRDLNKRYQKNLQSFSPTLLRKEFERLTIEFSWKSSHIEGNTYSLLETEQLIKEHRESPGHTKEEARMILNHKESLQYIRENENHFQTLSVRKIEELHDLLTRQSPVKKGLRKVTVGITGTRYRPLDNVFQIKEALEKVCFVVNHKKNIFEKALLATLLVAYIQPFEDGNKRTGRMVGNALLMSHYSCPLSYRSANEAEYKKGVVLFYEQNNLNYFKKLFLEQFEFAVKNYFIP